MPISVRCPDCRKCFQVADKFAGRKIRCPKCSEGVISIDSLPPLADSGPADQWAAFEELSSFDANSSPLPGAPLRSAALRRSRLQGWMLPAGIAVGLMFVVGGIWGVVSYASKTDAGQDVSPIVSPGADAVLQAVELDLPDLVDLTTQQVDEIMNESNRDWQRFASADHHLAWRVPDKSVLRVSKVDEGGLRYRWTPMHIKSSAPEFWWAEVIAYPADAQEPRKQAIARIAQRYFDSREQTDHSSSEASDWKVQMRDVSVDGYQGLLRETPSQVENRWEPLFFAADEFNVYQVHGSFHGEYLDDDEREAMLAAFHCGSQLVGDGNMHPFKGRTLVAGPHGPKDGIADWKQFRSKDPPFEILFPDQNVHILLAYGGKNFIWSQPINADNADDFARFIVSQYPRIEGESDLEAIQRVENLAQIAPSGTTTKGMRLTTQEVEFKGLVAIERTLTAPWGDRIVTISFSVAHPTGVYTITGMASSSVCSVAHLRAMRDSLEIDGGSPAPQQDLVQEPEAAEVKPPIAASDERR